MPLPLSDWRNEEAQAALAQRSQLPMAGQAIGRNLIDSSLQYDQNGLPIAAPTPQLTPNDYVAQNFPTQQQGSVADRVVEKLLGKSQERYQLWPERIVRDAISAPHDVMNSSVPMTSEDMIKPAMDISALAGTGGLAGAEAGAALGSGPFLRPALKYEGKIYKAPVKDANKPFMGAEHSDAIPPHLQDTFTKQAMSGEDISNFNFGFMNHKGQFLSREDALDYGIKEGLLSPHDAKFGALTSTMMADSKAGTAIGALEKSQSPFYSALEKNVADISQSKMTGDQWLGTLSNKPGVKPEEMDWTGLKSYLEGKGKSTISKEEVQAHLNDNALKIGEVNKGELSDKDIMAQSKIRQEDWDKMSQSQKELIRTNFPIDKTKYHSYQLPGGENYQEKLLTLPVDKQLADSGYNFNVKHVNEANNIYKSSHWDEPNILAHVRTNDRDIGGVPSKHIEEIQSDWHQQGRDKGYKGQDRQLTEAESKELLDLRKRAAEKGLTDAEHERKFELGTIQEQAKNNDRVPDAPFKKSWPELAMKRTIRQAVEEGKSRVSWTPGEAQAARYDLSKQVGRIAYNPETEKLSTWRPNADLMQDRNIEKIVKPSELAAAIGKEAAEKIMNNPTRKTSFGNTLEGLDLKIGGEGMKGFYDQMLPAMVEKIGKKYGVKVKQGETKAVRIKDSDTGKQKVHYFDIPEKMKQDILTKGFPLFSKGVPVIPTQKDK